MSAPAAAAAGAPYASTSTGPSLAETVKRIQEWKDNPTSDKLNKEVPQLALEALLKQEDPHWFCQRRCDRGAGSNGHELGDGHNEGRDDRKADREAGASASRDVLEEEEAIHRRAEKERLGEIATFCVRMVGYKASGRVADWKAALYRLLLDCHACVSGWVLAQAEVGDRFLRTRFSEEQVATWVASLHLREQGRVKDHLRANAEGEDPLPTPLIYNILLDSVLYSDPEVHTLLSERLSVIPIKRSEWPTPFSPPSGLFLFLLHPEAKLRKWAIRLVSLCDPVTMNVWARKSDALPKTVAHIFDTLGRRDRARAAAADQTASLLGIALTLDQEAFWAGMARIIGLLTPDVLTDAFSGGGDTLDIVRLVASHLGDKANHWIDVLRTFRLLLEKLDERTWRNVTDKKGKGKAKEATIDLTEPDDEIDLGYAGARLHDALDNPEFAGLLQKLPAASLPDQSSIAEALFGWLYPFLRSLRTSTYFQPCFAIISRRLLDDMGQQLRFEPAARASSISAAVGIFHQMFALPSTISASDGLVEERHQGSTGVRISTSRKGWLYLDEAEKDVEQHIRIIVRVAFDRIYTSDPVWQEASEGARVLIADLTARDSHDLREYVYALADARKGLLVKENPPPWRLPSFFMCETLLAEAVEPLALYPNVKGISAFIRALATHSHLARLSSRSWLIPPAGNSKDRTEPDRRLKSGIKVANEALELFSGPICKILRALGDEDQSLIRSVITSEGTGEALTILVLSPTESVAVAAQSLLRQAYDVTTRSDCIKALFQHIPEAALRGIIAALRTFKDSAVRLPEACGQAKRLVRCLTDVINVLCDPIDRFIRDETWVEKHNAQVAISKIWNLMCADIALIFERTEHWAATFENEEMTDWMRDASIFMDEMLDEIRTFEAAATGHSANSQDPTPRKMSTRGREMVEALNEPFGRMVSWFRLNDRDLVDRTVNIAVKLIERFAKARLPVHRDVVSRVRNIMEKSKDAKRRKDMVVRQEQLMLLLSALAKHPDHAEEFANIVEEDERRREKLAQKNAESRQKPMTLDESDDDGGVVLVGTKAGHVSSSGSKKAANDRGRPTAPFATSSSGRAAQTAQGRTSTSTKTSGIPGRPGAVPLKTSGGKPTQRIKTAPTRMGSKMIYSHSAMRAARDGSSSDEGDWSDKDPNKLTGLAGLAAAQAKRAPAAPQIKRPEAQRQTKMLDPLDPRRGQQPMRAGQRIMTAAELQQKSQNKARMRYNPDYTELHRQILQWSYLHQGTIPPGNFRFPRSIPPSFRTVDQYIETFLPLLLLECWNEIITAREELEAGTSESEPVQARLGGRATVDDFTELFMSVERMAERNPFSENDIVLLKGPCQTLGKIHQIIRKQGKIEFVVRCHLGKDDGSVHRGLTVGTDWKLHRVLALSTAHREYAALMALPYYDLLDEVLEPPHHMKLEWGEDQLQRAMKAWNTNQPQAGAILSAVGSHGFSLIQGPPGTGKTKTILGLVGAFISNRGRRPNQHSQAPEKILLCAPSNAAVDEVAKRLKEGVFDSDGKKIVPKVVRIGAGSSINVSVADVFLDNLVEKQLAGATGQTIAGDAQNNINTARSSLVALKAQREEKKAEKANALTNTALMIKLGGEISMLTSQINDLGDRLDRERDRLTQSNRAMESQKRKVRADILADADVICATLSGSGHDYLANIDFETVIIDEAAQSVEISSLIPLKYNCQRCIMVGDPNQLPPTVKSREATNAGYNRSLFVRLHNAAPEATHLLSIQYRMHPDISSFPSKAFYESRLSDGPNMATVTQQPWHNDGAGGQFPPYAFLHVRGGREERAKHHSLFNYQEAALAVALYARLLQVCRDINLDYRVGVITAYKGQVLELRKQFRRRFGEEILNKVDFNTVDGFQGQEKDIIILSCVRGGKEEGGGIGFLSDVRRMNVALTRARSSLFILGDSKALRANEHWGKLVEDATERGMLREVDPSSFALNAQVQQQAQPNKAMLARKTSGPRGKVIPSPSKQILPAPLGLMTPAEMARNKMSAPNSGVGPGAGSAGGEGVSVGIGIKRRLIGNMVKQEEDADPERGSATPGPGVKRIKTEETGPGAAILSNAASDFASNKAVTVKREEKEEGEIAEDGMQGVVYTHDAAPPQQKLPPRPVVGPQRAEAVKGGVGPGPPASITSTGTSSSVSAPPTSERQPASASTSTNGHAQPVKTPQLVAPKKPAASSMFIARKRPAVPARRP